ncbi:DUF5979 domain-containing protein [Corynebacterium pseudotuberculosis]|uniref:DUF5979 domain-containing protein n=1 Tax=Corynebacterium pseudotuberculosis TaxID=1719 RepID=UPI001F4257B9|nr:DUF5979 domain-containing protein [Corynebacterium pseudotuberculosis]
MRGRARRKAKKSGTIKLANGDVHHEKQLDKDASCVIKEEDADAASEKKHSLKWSVDSEEKEGESVTISIRQPEEQAVQVVVTNIYCQGEPEDPEIPPVPPTTTTTSVPPPATPSIASNKPADAAPKPPAKRLLARTGASVAGLGIPALFLIIGGVGLLMIICRKRNSE